MLSIERCICALYIYNIYNLLTYSKIWLQKCLENVDFLNFFHVVQIFLINEMFPSNESL